MSFLDSIGSGLDTLLNGGGTVGTIARVAGLSLALNQLTSAIEKTNDAKPATDYGVREQIDPNTDYSIPVVYGQAYTGGSVTDAVMTNNNQTMWYCITICEKTGPLMSTMTNTNGVLSGGTDSVIKVDEVYWNENKVVFHNDGITVLKLVDASGNESTTIDGLVKMYVYTDGSYNASKFANYPLTNVTPAYNIFPNWNITHTMDELVFVLIQVDYNKDKGITGIGNLQFKVTNSMSQPGDVLYDYMTNSRYGAGISPEEIYSA